MSSILTPHNIQLSGPTGGTERDDEELGYRRPTEFKLPPEVLDYVRRSRAESSRRAYASDLHQFMIWGGAIPASPEMVASYIASQALHLSSATINRRLASIAVAHGAKGYSSPTSSELVRSVVKGIRRTKGIAQTQAKPLLRDDLFTVLDAMGNNHKDLRDRALLLLGFAGGFRRSELVGLDVSTIAFVRQGIAITLYQSKTDQEGRGRNIGIPHGRTRHCPVRALEMWLQHSTIAEGPIFRPINRHGVTAPVRLSGEAVSEVIRERLRKAGISPEGYSGHSLRSGFVTSAAIAGVATWRIRKQTGHASDVMLNRYVRDGELFTENAAGALL